MLLHQRLEHAVQRASRSHTDLAILFVDLDRFKAVNDSFGHRVGDELLIAVGDRLRHIARPGDTVARMAGDEFVLLCEDLEHSDQVDPLARRVVAALAAPFELSGSTVTLTASVGIAFAGRGDRVPEQVLDDADEAMYQAKRAGGARHQLIDLRERDRSTQRASLERDLRDAVASDQLRLDYQPIVRTIDGVITGVEALLRWDHPRHGCIAPDIVIPLAEQSGAIIGVGRWVLERACADLGRMQAASRRRDLEVCVNVSAHQLMATGFCRDVEEVLASTATHAASLTLEVTESAYIEDYDRAIVGLDALKQLGVRIALDDFGTGYSSLSYLQQFPIDVLKIDRRFIAKLGREPASGAIVQTVIDLAHILDQRVVAEGVETSDQHDQLTLMGCDFCQGFYFAPPAPVDALERGVLLS